MSRDPSEIWNLKIEIFCSIINVSKSLKLLISFQEQMKIMFLNE